MTSVKYAGVIYPQLLQELYDANEDAYQYAKEYHLVGGDSKFQRLLNQAEKWDIPYKCESLNRIPHAPYHDMESLFWTIAWHCVRSQPVPSASHDSADVDDPDSRDPSSSFTQFCTKMLRHRVGEDTDARIFYRKQGPHEWERILHPSSRNKGLGDMLHAMATYLSFPWQHVLDDTYPEHAHDMMVLMLLNVAAPLIRAGERIALRTLPRPLPSSLLDPRSSQSRQLTISKFSQVTSGPAATTNRNDEDETSVAPFSERSVIVETVESWIRMAHTDSMWFM